MEQEVHIRWAIRRDLPEILQVENACFEYPLTEEEILQFLRGRNNIGMVAEAGDDVVGLFLYELHKKYIHIYDLAVHPDWQRQGIGTQMVEKLKSKMSPQRRVLLEAEVWERSLGAQQFLRTCGFLAVKVFKDAYPNAPGDAYLMQYRLQPTLEEALQPGNRISRYYAQ